MKSKVSFFAALAAFGLFSCSNGDDPGMAGSSDNANGGPSSLSVAVLSSSALRLTSMDDTQADGTTIQSLVMKVYDAAGNEITISGLNPFTGGVLANIMKPVDDLALNAPERRVVEQIDQKASRVEIRGYNSATPPVWKSKADFDAAGITTLQLGVMPFAEIPFISVSADGRNDITKTGLGMGTDPGHETHNVWAAQAEIKPYFARIEVSGTPAEKDNKATFTVESIYINNIALMKDAAKTMYKGNGGIWQLDPTTGKITGTTGDMDAAYKTAFVNMYDETLTGYGTAGKVDAYTLWGQSGMLHVIVKVKVTPANGDPAYSGFITLKNITGASAIEIGKIYKLDLSKLSLTYTDDITPQPYDEGADLYIQVTVHPWEEVILTPGL